VKRSVHLLGPGSTAVVIGAGGLGQMAIQVLKAVCSATTGVAVDTSEDKLKIATQMGADEGLVSGEDAVKRIKDMPRGQGAEVVLDFVGINPTLTMAAQVSRVLGHPTVVGLGNAALPVNFNSPAKECCVASPFWGSIPELIERTFPARQRCGGLPPVARRQDPGPRRHHTRQLTQLQRGPIPPPPPGRPPPPPPGRAYAPVGIDHDEWVVGVVVAEVGSLHWYGS
jgi:hypothetical protein